MIPRPDDALSRSKHRTCGSELAREGNVPASRNISDVPAFSRASSLPQKSISIQAVVSYLMRADRGYEGCEDGLSYTPLFAACGSAYRQLTSNLPIRQRSSGIFGVGQDADAFLVQKITHGLFQPRMCQVVP